MLKIEKITLADAILDFSRSFSSRREPPNAKLLKAPAGLRGHPMINQGYCRTQGNLPYQPQTLDPTPEAPFLIPFPPIRLLINDSCHTPHSYKLYNITFGT